MNGQCDFKGGTHADFAFDRDGAMVAFDDAVSNRQAKPSAYAHRFGGEERVEDVLLVVSWNA